MITNIPRQKDYERIGLSLLNLAWDTTLSLAVDLDDARDYANSTVSEKKYWLASQTHLSTAISLVQQATEFLLKSRIAAVSPLLLITGNPREWPRGCNTRDVPFAEFYTIDAQDLVRAHDAAAKDRLPERMKIRFEEMRRLRNSIVHTVDKRLKLGVKQVIVAVLEISDWFNGSGGWIDGRRAHIELSPNSLAYESPDLDSTTFLLARETLKCVEILEPAEVKRFFGFDKKQRRYICPHCAYACRESDLQPELAILNPNAPQSSNLHCLLCDQNFTVVRKKCTEKGCKGNVYYPEDEVCLTCYGHEG